MKLTKDLAYEVGVHIGDGNMYSHNRTHRISYSGDLKNERDYYRNILKPLISRLFSREVRYYERSYDNCVLLILNSKEILRYKRDTLKLPAGKKMSIRIPKQIRNNHELLMSCLRGIGDTDFSLSFKKNRKGLHTEPRLELYSQSRLLIKDLKFALEGLNITFAVENQIRKSYKGYMIRIYGKRNLKIWLDNVGFSNPYRLVKLNFWKKFGFFVPRKDYMYYSNKIK